MKRPTTKTSPSSTRGMKKTANGPAKSASSTTFSASVPTAPAKPSASITWKKKPECKADATLQEVLNRLESAKTRCVDVETSGLDFKRNHIVGYVVTFSPKPQDSYYVPFRHRDGGNVGERKGPQTATGWDGKLSPGEDLLIKKLDQDGTLLFGHNIAFDLRFMHKTGFTLKPRIEDTIINEPILDEYVGHYSLEACAARYKVQHKKSAEIVNYLRSKFPEIKSNDKGAMGHYWRLRGDDATAVDYARTDGTSTWQLRDKQMPLILAEQSWTNPITKIEDPPHSLQKVHDIESRLIPVLVRMMVTGVKVDEERMEAVIEHIDGELERLNNEFPSGFNTRSPNDVRAWMEKHNQTNWPYTKPSKRFPKGQPSFNSAWLETSEPGRKIIKVRKFSNIKNTFIFPLRDRHMFNGRVHTTFNQLRGDEFGTVTGRLSSSDPNMQQVPKHDEELGRLFRSIFVPDFGVWGDRDYSQIEPRLMAYYTRSKVFLDDYRNNPKADAHTAVAKAANKNWNSLDKAAQKHYRNNFGKRINQTVITGGGKGVLVDKYKVDPREVDRMLADYHRTLPELKPFQNRAAKKYRARGYMLSLLDRVARLDDPNRDYTALNRLLQVGNADILKVKMVEIDDYLESQKVGGKRPALDMLLNCHDALSFQFDESARKHYDHIKVVMEDFSSSDAVIKLDLPMTVDDGEGPNWSIATYGEEEHA